MGLCIVAQWLKLMPTVLVSHWVPVCAPASLLIPFPANDLGKASEVGPHAWVPARDMWRKILDPGDYLESDSLYL